MARNGLVNSREQKFICRSQHTYTHSGHPTTQYRILFVRNQPFKNN